MKTLAFAFLLFATGAIDVNTSKLADGVTETFSEGSRLVAVHRSGDTTTVRVQEGDRVDTVSITRQGANLSIGHSDNGAERRFIVVDRPKVVVDGIDLEPWLTGGVDSPPASQPDAKKRKPRAVDYFVCPKDSSVLAVPDSPQGAMYKCPVDGTSMRRTARRGLPYSPYHLLE